MQPRTESGLLDERRRHDAQPETHLRVSVELEEQHAHLRRRALFLSLSLSLSLSVSLHLLRVQGGVVARVLRGSLHGGVR